MDNDGILGAIKAVEDATFERERYTTGIGLSKRILQEQDRDLREYLEGVRRKAENVINARNGELIAINDKLRAIQEQEHIRQEAVIEAKERLADALNERYNAAAKLGQHAR